MHGAEQAVMLEEFFFPIRREFLPISGFEPIDHWLAARFGRNTTGAA